MSAKLKHALAHTAPGKIYPQSATEAVRESTTDSEVLSGRKTQLLAWRREFAANDRTIYTLLPDTIENSEWKAVDLSGNNPPSGSYAAKWRHANDVWAIEAEIYLTWA